MFSPLLCVGCVSLLRGAADADAVVGATTDLVVLLLQRESYRLTAVAHDGGYPSLSRSVDVQIDVVDRANNPPVWTQSIYGPIYIKENLPVGAGVISVKARSVDAGGCGE